ncbi:MAG: ribosome-associated translation inhibitor RaiA [Abditibacteriales bacterium]|nr:ribosome-associated translation inhibitor RaiA [Abditibacteriales bacterium]MDW8365747.1 ribosome-associated translation inhibitor RaiA [Abditibacteriales bacterium]
MQVIVRGRNVQVTPALKEHAEKKAQHLERYFHRIDEVLVTQRTERNWNITDVTVQAGGLLFRAEERSNDPFVAVDMAMEKLERQMKTFKDRRATLSREMSNRTLSAAPETAEVPPGAEGVTAEATEGSNSRRIIRRKRFLLKPMPLEEAVMQMELLGHDFFVFSNAETEQVNVLYKRNDGNYGLIEPEV